MAIWRYEGVDKKGKKISGELQATSEQDVRKYLRSIDIRPKKITPPSILDFDFGEWMVEKGLASPFGAKELTIFTKQLSVMINAGVPILQSLEILYKAERNPSLKLSVKKISTMVAEGKTIAEAMESQKGFSKLYCNLVKAGEAGGILDFILNKLASQMEATEKLKSQFKSAMMYPAIVCVIGAAVVYAMLVFVVPQFVGMLKESGQELPAITQFVVSASEFFGNNALLIFGGAIGSVMMFLNWKKTETGKIIFDRSIIRFPLIGDIVIKGNLATFARTLATLLNAGVSLIDALQICAEITDNTFIQKDVLQIRKKVMEGSTLTEPILRLDYFPEMVSQMIRVGEQTGQVDNMLAKVAEVFEDEVNNLIAGMTKLIEPIIIVVLGGIIATILVAMYLPIFMSAGGA